MRDPAGDLEPQAFFCTDITADPIDILGWFVRRWQVKVTFQDCRAHLGVETQRQWSDQAILRTTPVLLGMYSLTTLWATALFDADSRPRGASWYSKTSLTFSDAIAAVRHSLWLTEYFATSHHARAHKNSPTTSPRVWRTRSATSCKRAKSS